MPAKKRTIELEDKIVDALSEGQGLTAICQTLGLGPKTVRDWQAADEQFDRRVALARRQGLDVWADEIVSISDEVAGCTDTATVMAARLRVDSRKWILSKLAPQRYGDKVELTGKDGRDLIAAPEAAIPRLMQVLAVLLPASSNSELHALATTMAGKLALQGPKASNGEDEEH